MKVTIESQDFSAGFHKRITKTRQDGCARDPVRDHYDDGDSVVQGWPSHLPGPVASNI